MSAKTAYVFSPNELAQLLSDLSNPAALCNVVDTPGEFWKHLRESLIAGCRAYSVSVPYWLEESPEAGTGEG